VYKTKPHLLAETPAATFQRFTVKNARE